MRRVCAWCKRELGTLHMDANIEDVPITHGICGDGARKTMSFTAMSLESFLNQFSEPIFLINPEGRIIAANSAGYFLLRKKPSEVNGKLGGDAFSCEYADLPGGCGDTIHCKTCTIRITVMNTLQSGRSNVRIAAYPDLHHITGEYQIRFLISTEKVGESVLLRIDDVTEENATRHAMPQT